MSKTGFIKLQDSCVLPITRGDLVKDDTGNPAFESKQYEATEKKYGLLSPDDKKKLNAILEDSSQNSLNITFSSGEDVEETFEYPGTDAVEITVLAGDNMAFESDSGGTVIMHAMDNKVAQVPIFETNVSLDEKDIPSDFYPLLLGPALATNVVAAVTDRSYINGGLLYNASDRRLKVDSIDSVVDYAKWISVTEAIGSEIQPVYVDSDGTITASTAVIGGYSDDTKQFTLMFMLDGKFIDACKYSEDTAPINIGGGSTTFKLIHVDKGCITPAAANITIGGGVGTVPETSTYQPVHVYQGSITKAATTVGSGIRGVYMNKGLITSMTHILEANIYKGDASNQSKRDENPKPLAVYSSAEEVKISTATIGDENGPVYLAEGVLTPLSISSGSTKTLYLTGVDSEDTSKFYTGVQDTYGVRLIGGNKVYAYGGFFESSDESLKNFHSNIPIDLDALSKLPKKYFTWKSDNTNTQIGTSAQELQKIYPELVSEDSDGILHVAYDKLSVVALAAIDKLYNSLEDMRTENEELKVRLERLERLLYEN